MLPLLGTETIKENWFTPNFGIAFQQQKKKLLIKAHGLKLTQNPYTLVVMKDENSVFTNTNQKNLVPLAGISTKI